MNYDYDKLQGTIGLIILKIPCVFFFFFRLPVRLNLRSVPSFSFFTSAKPLEVIGSAVLRE